MKDYRFKPMLMMCGAEDCGEPLQSRYPGHFVACSEHSSYVDQTVSYDRYGGVVEVDVDAMQEAWRQVGTLEWWAVDESERAKALVWVEEMDALWGGE